MTSTALTLPLTQGFVAVVDEEDFENLSQWKWTLRSNSPLGPHYAIRVYQRRHIRMHRFILGVSDPLVQVDHRNGDGLDNRRVNLRIASGSQNQRNRGLRADNTSGYIGVHWVKSATKWRAMIRVDGKGMHLGVYSDPAEAARVYDKAARDIGGEFARLNFPDLAEAQKEGKTL